MIKIFLSLMVLISTSVFAYEGERFFVDRQDCDPRICFEDEARLLNKEYMLAKEMEQLHRYLTGFTHSAFRKYDSLIGKQDATTGQRTNDRVSVIVIFILRMIAADTATRVVNREKGLADAQRIVFKGVDLTKTPKDADFHKFVKRTYEEWLFQAPNKTALSAITTYFRTVEKKSGTLTAYRAFVETMLQHGALYFY